MKVERWIHEGSPTTYLVGDELSGVGLVIDPPPQAEAILEQAERLGISIEHVFFTADADGALTRLGLFRARGAHVYRCSRSIPRADVTALLPGSAITIGRIRLQVEPRSDSSGRRVGYRVHEIADDGRSTLVLEVPAETEATRPPSGEYDGYPRSSFLQSFSRW